jgi:hypothetical protein
MGDGKIIIAKTGVTTEFNLTDLNIESVGAGNATMSKIAGTAINLNFNITQVGDTNLVDTIQNAIALSGYHTINTTTFYIKINFVGFDGFNKEFSNAHAFSGRVGLKDTDTRRDWNDSIHSYVNVFVDAYTVLASLEDNNRLRNLGEGLDYNLGTELSKKYFPLSKDIYETIR